MHVTTDVNDSEPKLTYWWQTNTAIGRHRRQAEPDNVPEWLLRPLQRTALYTHKLKHITLLP